MEYFNAPIVFVCTRNQSQRDLLQIKQNVLSAAVVALLLGVTPEMLKVTIAILPSDLCIGFPAYTLYASLIISLMSC